jgi:hypothetical protein
MPTPTPRLPRRIEHGFPDAGSASEVAEIVEAAGEAERVQAAVVLWANGDLAKLRDVLVRSGR